MATRRGGISPIAGIDKAFLRRWLRWLETTGPKASARSRALHAVNVQEPTAELRPAAAGQTDEADLMPYELLDAIERAAIRDKRSPMEVFQLMQAQFPQYAAEQLLAWVERFFRLWCRNQWKRERYAPSFHVDDENLDPKTWCRFPILSGGYERELAELRAVRAKPAEQLDPQSSLPLLRRTMTWSFSPICGTTCSYSTFRCWKKSFARSSFTFFWSLACRIAGKRQLAQLNPFRSDCSLDAVEHGAKRDHRQRQFRHRRRHRRGHALAVNFLVVWYLYGHQRLEHLIEGDPDLLIKDGKIRHKRLKHELITLAELEAAARRQGFTSLGDVDRAILEPGGTISFCAKTPPIEESRHGELLTRLDGLLAEIKSLAIQASQQPKPT